MTDTHTPRPGNDAPPEDAAMQGQRLSWPAVLGKHAALIATVLLFLAGTYALYRLLSPLDMRAVLRQLRATPPELVLGAVAATAAGYAALIGYDWSALRYLGKRVPLPTIALGGFLGYAFGNTIGLSAVSGGAVRYRIYSALGLDAYDVAAVSSFAAISYGFGATIIGLGALAIHPQSLGSVTAMDPALLRLLALAAIALALGTLGVLSVRGGTLRVGRFSLRAPTASDLGRQALFSSTDIVMAALVLHILLPPGSLPFANLLAVYAVASMAGVASHVPGGVGVFESVVLAALPGTVAVHDAVTALLLYRLIYFLLPFVIALAGLSLSEIWTASGRKVPQVAGLAPVLSAGRAVIPLATGFLVLGSGIFMMFAGLLPNPRATVEEFDTLLPLAVTEGGPMLSSIIGSLLVVLSVSVFRRSRLAFWIVVLAALVSLTVAAAVPHDLDRVIMLALALLILLPCRREFYRPARLMQGVLSPRWLALSLSIIVSLWLIWYLVHENSASAGLMWWQLMGDAPAMVAWRAALTGAVMLSAILIFAALRTARPELRLPDEAQLQKARGIIDSGGHASDMLALTGDKYLMFTPDEKAVISFGIKGASWVALGAPAGRADACEELAWAFQDSARAAGARPVFYEAPASFAPQAIEMGLSLHKMGEEAVVSLPDFSLEGPSRKRLRTTYNRALRDGLSFEVLSPPHDAALIAELGPISQAWLAARAAREKAFSVGAFCPAYLQRVRIAVVRHEGRIVAFASLLEAAGSRSAAVDLMRHGSDGPGGVMEFLFTALMLHLADEGLGEFSLGMVPFAGLSARSGAGLWTRFGALVYAHGDRFYNFDGLRRFKMKFDPAWQPRYFCCRTALPPVAPLTDAARLIAGSAQGIIGK